MIVCTIFVLLGAAQGTRAAEADRKPLRSVPDVFVPSFWDAERVPDKPNLDGLANIRFVTGGDHPPFSFAAPDGTLVGFDIDLARALCDELKTACTVQVRRYDTIVPALKADLADAAIASMAITPQALHSVDFTSPYYRTPARFVARRDNILADVLPESIGTRPVGVERGTAHEAYLKAFFPTAAVRSFDSAVELQAALGSGTIDLMFGDGITLAQWMQSPVASGCCAFTGGPFTESRFFGQGAGIAVRKGNEPLRAALDYALARLAAQGTYADLYLKYFPVGIY